MLEREQKSSPPKRLQQLPTPGSPGPRLVPLSYSTGGWQPTLITGINLYFYNVPSMGIGLPHDVELSWGSIDVIANDRLEHIILGNQDLSLNDSTLRNVTLVATTNGSTSYASVGIRFRFSSNENNIRWLIVTEIELCNEGNEQE